MKTEIGVGAAVLAAFAAEGKDFDRAELNAMLDKLAASPEPKSATLMMATCYVKNNSIIIISCHGVYFFC